MVAEDAARRYLLRRAAVTSNKLGNAVTLTGPSSASLLQPVSILKANIDELGGEFFDAAAWVLTLEGSNVVGGSAAPLLAVATVKMGAGGAGGSFDVSILPGCSIQVPSSEIEVSAQVRRWNGFGWSLRVTAFLKPGFSSSKAHRVFACGVEVQDPDPTELVPIPPFSREMMIYANDGSGSLFYGLPLGALTFTGGGTTIMTYSGAEVLAILRAGGLIPIPGGATHWNFSAGVALFINNLRADFLVQL